jgi:ABC-2 type transport system permease protein
VALSTVEAKTLWRAKTPLIFFLALPVILSLVLGPAIDQIQGTGMSGRPLIGFAVLFSYMTANYAGHAFYSEYWNGTWVRQAMLQPSRAAYVAGKLGPITLVGFLQLLVFVVVAAALHGLPLTWASAVLLPLLSMLSASGAALGMVLFVLTDSMRVFSSLVYLVLIAFGSLGGAIAPVSSMPEPWRTAGMVTPHYWAMRGIEEVMFGQGSWTVVAQSTGVVLVQTAVLLVVGVALLNLRRQKLSEM